MQYEKEILDCIRRALGSDNKSVFDSLIDLFKSYFEKPAHNITELKARNTKMKGDIFEIFCCLYLQKKGFQVWLLKDLPQEYLDEFKLDRKDHGIDLVANLKKGDKVEWFCVQCKYRKPSKNSLGQTVHRINWKDISTFLALASKTGPARTGWKKNIVMTNADYVCWKGKKSQKDFTIAKKTFEGCTRTFWNDFIGLKPHSLLKKEEKEEEEKEEEDQEDNKEDESSSPQNVRNLRQKWLDSLGLKK